jgi:hypothetical protein
MRPVILAIAAASAVIVGSSLPSRAADFEAPYSGQPGPYAAPGPAPYGAAPAPGPYAAPGPAPYGVQPIPEEQVEVEPTQYVYGGYNYCWYPGGWRGPGWYVCNYGPWVTGYWWGGPIGWHGWWGGGRRFYGHGYGGGRFYGGGFHGGGFHGGGFHGGGGGFHHH